MSQVNEARYFQPNTIQDLMGALTKKDERTYLYAGGTDMIIYLRNHGIFDYSIIDLSKMYCYRYIDPQNDGVMIGALTTMSDIIGSEYLKENYRALWQAAKELGSTQIRNLATLGGNIANASQSADTVPTLMLYRAEVILMDDKGTKTFVPIDEFVVGRGKTILGPNQVITAVRLYQREGMQSFKKLGARKAVTISKVNCSMNVVLEDQIIREVECLVGVIGEKAIRAMDIEQALLGKPLPTIAVEDLSSVCFDCVEQAIPNRSSKLYKRIALKGVLLDAIEDLRSQL
ncbi:MAG: FAD binding domain-containing protein [Tissierellia bacterium]|nr:FAD binding domain-containing protein [Tissierellia bacterium]